MSIGPVTEVPKVIVDAVKAAYGLADSIQSSLLSTDSKGLRQPAIKLITRERSFVLRSYRDMSFEQIKLHNSFLHWAQNGKFPLTQRILAATDGSEHFRFEGKDWWVSDFIEADESFEWSKPGWTALTCNQAGVALKELHTKLWQFQEECEGMPRPLSSIQHEIESGRDSVLSAALFPESEQALLRNCIDSSLQSIVVSPAPRAQLVHGDYHPGNILIDSGEIAGIIDLEYLRYEPAVYDVSYALVMFCANWSSDIDDGSMQMPLVEAFLTGYGRLSDRALLLPYIRIAALLCLTWFVKHNAVPFISRHFFNVLMHSQRSGTIDFLSNGTLDSE